MKSEKKRLVELMCQRTSSSVIWRSWQITPVSSDTYDSDNQSFVLPLPLESTRDRKSRMGQSSLGSSIVSSSELLKGESLEEM